MVRAPGSLQRPAQALWEPVHPLYASGDYAAAADRGRELVEANLDLIDSSPEYAEIYYNVACCESLAGRTDEAIEHLRAALGQAPEPLRAMAADDPDFDPIRAEPAFKELVG